MRRRWSKGTSPIKPLERLERRICLAAVAWDGGGDQASWNDPLNWSGNAVPALADDVTIGAGVANIQVNNPLTEINSLKTSSPLTFAAAAKLRTGYIEIINGSRIKGAIIEPLGASGTFRANGGFVDGVTLESDWLMGGDLYVANSLTLNGVVTAGSVGTAFYCRLVITESAAHTLNGTGRLDLDKRLSGIILDTFHSIPRKLTIGADLTIRTTGGTEWGIGWESTGNGSEIINLGHIESHVAGGKLSLGLSGSTSVTEKFTNNGVIDIANGGQVSIYGAWSSAGAIDIADGDLFTYGVTSAASLNQIHRTGSGTSSVFSDVTVSPTAPLNLTALTGSLEFRSGSSLTGPGAVNTSGGAAVVCNPTLTSPVIFENLDLNGVVQLGTYTTRIRGAITLSGTLIGGFSALGYDTGATLTAKDGARLTDARIGTISVNDNNANLYIDGGVRSATVRLNGDNARVIAEGTQTWTGSVSFLKPGTALLIKGNAATLTLASGSTISGTYGTIANDPANAQSASLINLGTITALTGGTLSVNLPGGVTNTGVVRSNSSGSLQINATFTQNAPGSMILSGGTITSTSPFNIAGGSYIVRAGSYVFQPSAFVLSDGLNVIVDGTGQLNFATDQTLASLALSQTGRAGMTSGASTTSLRVGSLSILNTATLDLANDQLLIDFQGTSPIGSWNGSQYTGITGLVATGRNGGTWDGAPAIVTSVATKNFTTLGVAEIAGDVTVKFTYGGDANLDGKLNVDDYIKIDTGIASALTGWVNGDFNYDGKINIDDYVIIDTNLPNQGPSLGTVPSAAIAPKLIWADRSDDSLPELLA